MHMTLKNVGEIKTADMELNGITVLLAQDNVPERFIGEAVFDCDYLLSRYAVKLYDHRAFNIVEICMKDDEIKSLSNKSKLYIFNRLDRVLKKKFRLYETLEEEIEEILNVLKEILDNKYLINSQIKINDYLMRIRQKLFDCLQQSIYDFLKMNIKTKLLPELSWNNEDIRITITDDKNAAEFIHKNGQIKKLKLLSNTYAVMNMESLSVCDILIKGYKKGSSFSEERLYKRVINGKYLPDENTVALINDVEDRNNLEVYGIDEDSVNAFYNILDRIIDRIEKTQDGYRLVYKYLNKTVNLQDASEALRCFADFKILLEHYFFCSYRWAKPKIIVFKEPAFYSNDEWQDLYAEFVVLLQKYIIPQVIIRTENKETIDKIAYYAGFYGTENGFSVYEAVEAGIKFNIKKKML